MGAGRGAEWMSRIWDIEEEQSRAEEGGDGTGTGDMKCLCG